MASLPAPPTPTASGDGERPNGQQAPKAEKDYAASNGGDEYRGDKQPKVLRSSSCFLVSVLERLAGGQRPGHGAARAGFVDPRGAASALCVPATATRLCFYSRFSFCLRIWT
jgi:hypothetical protein